MIELTSEQRQIQELAHTFARQEIRPVAAHYDETESVPWPVLEKAHAAGLTSFAFPEEYGGAGVTDTLTACLVAEELTWGCLSIGNLITSNPFGMGPVLSLGNEEQRLRFLPRFCEPGVVRLCALSVTEPTAGSDAAAIKTTARRTDGGYILNGRKSWTSNGGVADLYVIFATVDPALRHQGITAFVVEHDTPGLSFGKKERKMGNRAIPNCDVLLEDLFVPEENRLGSEGSGFVGLMRGFDRARVNLAASCLGVGRAALEYATEYARTRQAFGKPIGQHQAVGFLLADMATALDAARLLVWRAALLDDAGKPFTKEAAMAKVFASEMAVKATHDAQQVLGGYGYSRDMPLEKWYRDVRLEEIEEGTSQIQRLVIARRLLAG